MPNGKLTEHLDGAYCELRGELLAAKAKGEDAVKCLTLNGDETRLPQGITNAIAEVRGMYAKANQGAQNVLTEHLGNGRDTPEPEPEEASDE